MAQDYFQYKSGNSNHTVPEPFFKYRYTNILIVISIIIISFIISLYNYLLFHSLAEGFSIVIGCSIFLVIWNSRRYIENGFFIIIGVAFLFIAGLDFIHAVSYSGINVFPGNDPNLPTQIWIANKYIHSITFLVAALLLDRKIKRSFVTGIYVVVVSALLFSIFKLKIFPDCYTSSDGLTPFKIISEFLISIFFFISIILLIRKKENFAPGLLLTVISSIILSIAAEINFSFYTSPFSLANFTGHVLKVFSYYLIYKAIIVSGLRDPFNTLFKKLKQNEKALQLARFSIEHAKGLFMWISLDGIIIDYNSGVLNILGFSKESLAGRSFYSILNFNDDYSFEQFETNIKGRKSFLIEHMIINGDDKSIEAEIELNYLEFEGEEFYCAIARDITEKRKADEKLLESEVRFRNLADTAPVMIWMCDDKKNCVYVNKPWLEFTGRSIEDELGFGWLNLMHQDDKTECMKSFFEAFEDKKETITETRMKRQDGQYRWILNTGIPRFTNNGTFLGYIGSCIDITEIKRSREQLEYTLQEKVMLLKEIHHRVKNNMQVISSLFNLQSGYIQDEEARRIFTESQNRVKSMALLHEKLYFAKSSSYINFSDYLRDLITNLLNTYRFKLNTIDLELNIESLEMNIDTAVYLGLIVNELISNSFKHAFPENKAYDGSKSRLSVKLACISANKYEIVIKDNGIGLPEEIDFRTTDSLGMQLVNSLVDQIRGSIDLKRGCGTEFAVTFNLKL